MDLELILVKTKLLNSTGKYNFRYLYHKIQI